MPRNKNPEETIKKILDTAMDLFIEKGYEQTSILDIVEKMGVSRGAFYHHFKSKEEVLYACLEMRDDRGLQMEIYNNPDLTGLEKIRKLMFGIEPTDTETTKIVYMWFDLLKDPRILVEHLRECQGENISWITELVKAGMADGSIEENDPLLISELLSLLLNFWTIPTIYDPVDDNVFANKILMIKQMLDGLGCPIVDDEVIKMFDEMAQEYDVKND